MHLGVEHTGGLSGVSHESESNPIVGIHAGMERILINGDIDGFRISGGQRVEFSVGGIGLVCQDCFAWDALVLPGTSHKQQCGDRDEDVYLFHFFYCF